MPDHAPRRYQIRALTWALIVLGVAFVVVGVVYLTTTAGHLPSFFPGHTAGSTKRHDKHALAVFGLALLAWIGAWFSTAPSRSSSPSSPTASPSDASS